MQISPIRGGGGKGSFGEPGPAPKHLPAKASTILSFVTPPPPSLGEVPAELATLTVLFQASRKRIYLVMHRLTISSLLGLKKRVTDWCHLLNEEFVLGTERESRT